MTDDRPETWADRWAEPAALARLRRAAEREWPTDDWTITAQLYADGDVSLEAFRTVDFIDGTTTEREYLRVHGDDIRFHRAEVTNETAEIIATESRPPTEVYGDD